MKAHVGSVVRVGLGTARPGLTAALDLGRGPASVRITGTWVRVGSSDPLQQYTAELQLALGQMGRVVPVVGAGGGVARVHGVGAGGEPSGASTLGVGVLRAGLEYRLPMQSVDARLGIGVSGVLPVARSEGAPDAPAFVLAGATVGVGF